MKTLAKIQQEVKEKRAFLKGKPNLTYHFIWAVLSQVMGIVFVFSLFIHEAGFSKGILSAITILIVGTFCFLIVPILFNICFSIFPKYLTILAFPIYVILAVGRMFREVNDLSRYGYVYPLIISVVLSTWGYINIKTVKKARVEAGPDYDDFLMAIFPF